MALKAICIGINDYPGTHSDLNGCVNDANDWGHELRRRGFAVSTLLNKDATGDEIRKRIGALVTSAQPGDTIVVQFSGHGSFVPDLDGDEPDGTDECICPCDPGHGYITDDELFVLFAAGKSGVQIVMISDSCHSGTIAKFAPSITPSMSHGMASGERRVRFLPPAAFLDEDELKPLAPLAGLRRASAPARSAALTLTGCQDSEFSYDGFFSGRATGAFTYVALQALKTLPRGATYRQWHEAIRKRLPSPDYPQSPNLYGPRQMTNLPIFAARELGT